MNIKKSQLYYWRWLNLDNLKLIAKNNSNIIFMEGSKVRKWQGTIKLVTF